MARRLTLPTLEMGNLEVFLIYQYGDEWEEEWRPLQGHKITELFSVVSKEVSDFALKRYSKPLVKALSFAPEGALSRMPNQQCYRRDHCTFYEKKVCLPKHKKLPTCYSPEGIDSPEARILASEVVRLWREGVYVVVVQHD